MDVQLQRDLPRVASTRARGEPKPLLERSFDQQLPVYLGWFGVLLLAGLLVWGAVALISRGDPDVDDIVNARHARTRIDNLATEIAQVASARRMMPKNLAELAALQGLEQQDYWNGYTYIWDGQVVRKRFMGTIYAQPINPELGLPCVAVTFSEYGLDITEYAWDVEDLQ